MRYKLPAPVDFLKASLLVLFFVLHGQVASANTHQSLDQFSFVGTAYAIENEDRPEMVLYTEHHRIFKNDLGEYVKGKVEYRDAEGELIAVKELSFSSMQTLPELRFDDLRTRNGFETKNELAEKKSRVRLVSQEGSSIEINSVEIDKPGRSVVDAGFDLFVLNNWEALLKGEKVRLDFLALTRASFYGFYLKTQSVADEQVVIELKPSSFFLNMLIDPIVLTYDLKTKRLLRFQGLTNIEKVINGKAKGENYLARIEYVYQ
jgi:hypothetical protein